MRKALLLCLLPLLVGCKSKRLTANSPEKYEIENLAVVIDDYDLETIYPEARMIEGTELFEEGTIEKPYTVLYPNSPDKILIVWKDEKRDSLEQIYLAQESRWRSQTGIRVGTTYDELLELNQGPIKIYGFGWDHSGAVDWEEGALSETNIRVFLEPHIAPPRDFYTDRVIEPTPEEIKALRLTVRAILYREPEL